MSELVVPSAATKRLSRPLVLALVAAALVAATFAVRSLRRPPEPPPTVVVARGNVIARAQATGRIVPREEVMVRPLVAGELVELRVKPGDRIKAGDHIATVRVLADPVTLAEARAQARIAEVRLATANRELARLRTLTAGVSLSGLELARSEDSAHVALAELEAARERMRLIAKGAASGEGARSTRVTATIDGTVLATPSAVGDLVSDSNSYREGTVIAVVADMNQLLFKGQIEEAHVGKLRPGMAAAVRVGALSGTTLPGKLSFIARRATIDQAASGSSAGGSASSSGTIAPLTASTTGVTRFELWVELEHPPEDMRVGFTASAELAIEQSNDVLVLEERALRFQGNAASVRVLEPDGTESERVVKLGLADLANVEIVSGLKQGERVVLPTAPKPD